MERKVTFSRPWTTEVQFTGKLNLLGPQYHKRIRESDNLSTKSSISTPQSASQTLHLFRLLKLSTLHF